MHTNRKFLFLSCDSTGIVLEERVVNSDSCNHGFCSTNFSLLDMYSTITVTISASNIFGQSNATMITVDCIRLSTSNQVLLSLGVILLCIAILGVLVIVIVSHSKKGTNIFTVVCLSYSETL